MVKGKDVQVTVILECAKCANQNYANVNKESIHVPCKSKDNVGSMGEPNRQLPKASNEKRPLNFYQ